LHFSQQTRDCATYTSSCVLFCDEGGSAIPTIQPSSECGSIIAEVIFHQTAYWTQIY